MNEAGYDARRACERLMLRYAHTIDHGDFDTFANLFARDGRLSTPERTLEGREAIREAMRRRPPSLVSRHVITNIVVDLIDERNAAGLCYLVLFRDTRGDPERTSSLAGPALIGDYTDRFVLTEQGWRFASRDLALAFRRPARSSTR